MPDLQNGGLAERDVHLSEAKVAVPDTRIVSLPDVQVLDRAIEIRGSAAHLVQEILSDWVDAQQRRIEYLRRDGPDRETRSTIRRLLVRVGRVQRVLQAWEGVLTVLQEEGDLEHPDN